MRNLRESALFALFALFALSTFGQNSSQWRTAADIHEGVRGGLVGTVADVDEARSQIQVDLDAAVGGRVLVIADSLTTQYNGFGGVINGQPEIFTGSAGFSNLRVGDRIDVKGTGRGTGAVVASYITLLGRSVPADTTGVGTTRPPSSVSTPSSSTTTTSSRVGALEGTVQQVNASEGRIVIVTDRREIMTVRTASGTPVYYRGDTYRVANLEIGDRVRIEPESSGSGGEVRARYIEVTRSVQEGSATPAQRGTTVAGRVSKIDRMLDVITIDTGKQSIRIDVATSSDTSGHRVRAIDFREGDQITVTGRYSGTANDLFMAETVTWSSDKVPTAAPRPSSGTPAGTDVYAGPASAGGELPFVTIYGTVKETLATSPQVTLQDSSGRVVRINVLEDFVVRNKTGGYSTAEQLRSGDNVVVKAYRDADGNYIAQTIRIR